MQYGRKLSFVKTPNYAKAIDVYLAFFSVLIFSIIFLNIPRHAAVDPDYYYTLAAFANHATPEITKKDELYLEEIAGTFWQQPPYIADVEGLNGRRFGIHFWLWSLICLPAFKILPLFHIHPFRAHEITLALYLILTLYYASRYLRINARKRFWFVFFASFNPILWYLWIMGAEGFLYCSLLLCVVLLQQKKYNVAVYVASVASLQNSAIAPLALGYFILSVAKSKKISVAQVLCNLLYIAPIIISPLFYMYYFGRPTLFSGLKLTDINFNMFMTQFFDLGQGLIIYLPFITLTYLIILFLHICKMWPFAATPNASRIKYFGYKLFSAQSAILFSPVILTLSTSIMYNWCCGHVGLMRYGAYLLPFLVYTYATLGGAHCHKIRTASNFISLLLLILWFGFNTQNFQFNWTHYKNGQNPVAYTALKYIPKFFFTWNHEMFIDRVLWDGASDAQRPLTINYPYFPVVYADPDYGPRKILSSKKALLDFTNNFDISVDLEKSINDQITMKSANEVFYLNLPSFKAMGDVQMRALASGDMRCEIELHGFPEKMTTLQQLDFHLKVINASSKTFWAIPGNIPKDRSLFLGYGIRPVNSEVFISHHTQDLRENIPPNASVFFHIWQLSAPSTPGEYHLIASMGQRDVGDFRINGSNYLVHKFIVE